MLAALHKYLPGLLLLLAGVTGLALAGLVMGVTSMSLAPATNGGQAKTRPPLPLPEKPTLADYEVIVQRDIFDSTGAGRETLLGGPQSSESPTAAGTARSHQDITLIGTIVNQGNSLALVTIAKAPRILRLEDELPGGGTLVAVRRNEADIRYADGTLEILRIPREGANAAARPAASAAAVGGGAQVQALGGNRFAIARAEVEKARSNIGELLKQARMEPNIVNGETNGFVVKMIQPGSLLAQLGMQLGDVVTRVNGIELNSPEKALQIFQQLREARRLNVDLTRGGQPFSLQYEVN